MLRRTQFVTLQKDAPPEKVAEFQRAFMEAPKHIPLVLRSMVGKNIGPRTNGWDYMVDTLYESPEVLPAYREHPYHREVLNSFFNPNHPNRIIEGFDMVYFEPLRQEIVEPDIKDCVKRSLVMQVEDGTPKEKVRLYEKQLMEMPKHIPAIRNWAFSRAVQAIPPTQWTHVWEFELRRAEDFQDYLLAPFHWGVVDIWFNPEWPQRIVGHGFVHGHYVSPTTVLGWK